MLRVLTGCVAGVLLTACIAPRVSPDRSVLGDVHLVGCGRGVVGLTASLRVTNGSSERSSYSIDVAFESPDGAEQLGTGLAFVTNLEAGQSASAEAVGFGAGASSAPVSCRVTDVHRFAS